MPLASYAGPCWRAVSAGREAAVLDGTTRPGRYNRAGERALYLSGSPAGVAAAMARYGEAARTVLRVEVRAELLADLREAAVWAALRLDPAAARVDWLGVLEQGRTPASWAVADAVRGTGAQGMIEASRRAPGLWHLVLFRWNEPGGAQVERA